MAGTHVRGDAAPTSKAGGNMETTPAAEIGVFGGSGFYSLIEDAREAWVETPYGAPSDRVALGEIGGQARRFPAAPRQGPPLSAASDQLSREHVCDEGAGREVDHRADRCGSLSDSVKPGSMVVCRSARRSHERRARTRSTTARSRRTSASPIRTARRCARSRSTRCGRSAIETHERGTVVVIQGPRFSTRAESKWFQSQGWEVINMTQYPGGLPRARARDVLRQHLADHRLRRRPRGHGRRSRTTTSSRSSNATTSACTTRSAESSQKIPLDADCSCRHALEGARF